MSRLCAASIVASFIVAINANLLYHDIYKEQIIRDSLKAINNLTGSSYKKIILMPEVFSSAMDIRYGRKNNYADIGLTVRETNCTVTREVFQDHFDSSKCVSSPVSCSLDVTHRNLFPFREMQYNIAEWS